MQQAVRSLCDMPEAIGSPSTSHAKCCVCVPPLPQADRKSGSAAIGESGGRGMVDLNPPRGTRDFFPEDKRLQGWLFDHFAAVSALYAFEQVDFPVLESGAAPVGGGAVVGAGCA